MSKKEQVPLPFPARRKQTLANFLGAGNDELIARLGRAQSGFACLWLHGSAGAGKSHLLHAAVDAQRGYGRSCTLVDLRAAQLPETADEDDVLALDHLEPEALSHDQEQRLVALYQALRVRGGWLLVASSSSPLAGDWRLADLASRLKAAQTYTVEPLNEKQVRALLARQARERGLDLPKAVVDYWLTRRDRALPALLDDLERLDRAAWVEQRRLTVPFMKGVLEAS